MKEKTDRNLETEEELQEETEAEEETEGLLEEEEAGTVDDEEVLEEETPKEEEIKEEAPLREKEEEEKYVEERIYTIPLRRAWIMPPKKRAPRAVRIIKAFIQRHMKVTEAKIEEESEEEKGGRIIISNEVNERIWRQGIEKPPRKIRIRAAKDEQGNVTIFLA